MQVGRWLATRSVALVALCLVGMAAAQTLVIGTGVPPTTLDGADSQDGDSLIVSAQVAERLTGFEPGGTELVPALATSWSANADATVWDFELRRGVTFHDGTAFDAEAVAFNFDRWNDPEHPYAGRDAGKTYAPWDWVFGGPPGRGGLIAEVTVLGEHEVRFTLTRPAPFLPALLGGVYFQIGSPTAIMEHGPAYGTPEVGAVGTGPFRFTSWTQGEGVALERNEVYWGGPAAVARVEFRSAADPEDRLAALRNGVLDVAVNLAGTDLASVETDTGLVVSVPESELNVGYLAMHRAHAPLDNLLVRQAIAHAVDRDALVAAFFGGLGVTARSHVPPSLFGGAASWPFEHDPARARELLAEAGLADGFATALWYPPISRAYLPAPRAVAEAIAVQLAEVGIEAELRTVAWPEYLERYGAGELPLYLLGWNAYFADPDNFLLTMFGPTAPAYLGWDDPEVRDLLLQARQVAEPEVREALYQRVGEAVIAAVPSVPLAHNRSLTALRAGVEGWVPSPLGYALVDLHGVRKED